MKCLFCRYGNNGCDGGEDFRSYQWILKHGGVPTDADYGNYLGEVSILIVTLHCDFQYSIKKSVSYELTNSLGLILRPK